RIKLFILYYNSFIFSRLTGLPHPSSLNRSLSLYLNPFIELTSFPKASAKVDGFGLTSKYFSNYFSIKINIFLQTSDFQQ
ncbi:MAG TPA: hypothetical protein H9752_08775, partial [Candidatus Phocaeicola excrementigallinarum]|nr:hypothetical protein [Candidatus Phocaeicola excrementigallinarum]